MVHGLKFREWVVFFAVIFIGITAVAIRQMSGGNDDITGTIAKAEPSTKQDGTPTHPYADAGQCPPSTDVIAAAISGVVVASGALHHVKLTRLLTQDEVVHVRQKASQLRSAYKPPGK